MLMLKQSLCFQSFVLLTFYPGRSVLWTVPALISLWHILSVYRISSWSFNFRFWWRFFFVPSLLPIWFVVCSYIYCDFYYKLIRSRKLFCSTWISSISFFNISCHKRFCIFACCALCFSCWFFRYVFFSLSLVCVLLLCAVPWLLTTATTTPHKNIPITVLAVCRTKDAYFMDFI